MPFVLFVFSVVICLRRTEGTEMPFVLFVFSVVICLRGSG